MDVKEDHVGKPLANHLRRRAGLVGLTHHLHCVPQLSPDARPKEMVVVHQEYPGAHGHRR